MANVYMYVVARDFGFAPNPFHGVCTLATCKPRIRSGAKMGDWVIGMGGSRLRATGRCIFAMRVTETLTFDQYWSKPAYRDKRPVRNGSRKMMVGDNIYHRDPNDGAWLQEDSHHSRPDGSINPDNVERDTKTNRVLISSDFLYFGSAAPAIPPEILATIGFVNGIGHRVYSEEVCRTLLGWLHSEFGDARNQFLGDPFQFDQSDARYSVLTDRVS